MHTVINMRPDGIALTALSDQKRWVSWREDLRDGKLVKVPYSPFGDSVTRAKANDPTTWGTRAEAEQHAAVLPRSRGIGIELGAIDDQWGIGGIDLDTCRNPETGVFEDWALEILRDFKTYAEISPSGKGAKLLFRYSLSLLPLLRRFMGSAEKNGKAWKRSSDTAHPPGIEFYLAGRYFTITEQRIEWLPDEIHKTSGEPLLRLLRVTGPLFAGEKLSAEPSARNDLPPQPQTAQPQGDLWDRIKAKAAFRPALSKLLAGNFSGMRDASRSGKAMALGGVLCRADFTSFEVAEALRTWPDTAEWAREPGGDRQIERVWLRAVADKDRPEAESEQAAFSEPKRPALWIDAKSWSDADIPKRPWVVPMYLMRGSVSVLSGQGAGGKSSLVVAWTISLGTGEAIGDFAPPTPQVVINYNVEDDQHEQRRRYSAALAARKMTPDSLQGRVIRCGPSTIGTLFERDQAGRIQPTPAMEALERLCMETQADVLVCDPLAELHNAEENDNTAMRAVIAAFRSMADRLGIAILILHHDRKGTNAPGDMDRMRGASAITGAVRVMLTLSTMTVEDADKFGIDPEHRRRHFRIDGAKSNYAPPSGAEWWRLAAFPLANGEDVAACLPWEPPTAFEGLSMGACCAILTEMQRGTTEGIPYGARKQAGEDWAGRILMREPLARTEGQAAIVLAAWEHSGLIEVADLASPRRGHTRKAYRVNDEAFSKMKREAEAQKHVD